MIRRSLVWAAFVLLVVLNTAFAQTDDGCQLPAEWRGRWYWKEKAFNITDTRLGFRGRCLERQEIKHLVETEREGKRCYICMVIFNPHKNIIEFKESRYCVEQRGSLRDLCREIGGDAPLHTMVRVSGAPEPCPIRGHFQFDYRRSRQLCNDPISRLSSCADPSSLMLHYQACLDTPGAERIAERVTCLASWSTYDKHYLFARLDSVKTRTDADRYRCYMYQRAGDDGYQMAQSGDSTCQGLQSVQDGYKVFTLYKENTSVMKCTLPEWFTAHHDWTTMDYSQRYHIYHKNHSIGITQGESEVDDSLETRLICDQLTALSADEVQLVVQRRRDCTLGYQCVRLIRRHQNIVQIKFGELTHSPEAACQHFSEERDFITLLASGVGSELCPMSGRYTVQMTRHDGRMLWDTCRGAFRTLLAGCDAPDQLQFSARCNLLQHVAEYRCHGAWWDDAAGMEYVVTSRLSTGQRLCLVAATSVSADVASQVAAESPAFTSAVATRRRLYLIAGDCGRRLRATPQSPESERWTFNVTRQGECRVAAVPDAAVPVSCSGAAVKLLAALIAVLLLCR